MHAHLGNLSAFVVSSENGDAVLVPHFEGDEKRDRFDRIESTINIISHEQIVRVRWFSTNTEELHQIVKLSMDISANCDGAFDRLDIRLVHENLTSLRLLNG